MKRTICFRLKEGVDAEEAWEALDAAGFELLYSSQDPNGSNEIFGEYEGSLDGFLFQFPFLADLQPAILPDIDWASQWSIHGLNYQDGYVNVNLEEFGSPDLGEKGHLRLKPGPGFGDLSHPTTHLVLKLMAPLVKNKEVIDVGCGSGILSLAAAAMGASKVHGIDIDPQAITHAQENALLNNFLSITFSLPDECRVESWQKPVVVMNMIASEQMEAWNALHGLHGIRLVLATSGILKEGRHAYLAQTEVWGWQLVREEEMDGWLGFVFHA